MSACHGGLIRHLTESQFPMVSKNFLDVIKNLFFQLIMKSVDGGKSYGKSSTGRSMLWLASCPEEGKVKASLKIEVMFEKVFFCLI